MKANKRLKNNSFLKLHLLYIRVPNSHFDSLLPRCRSAQNQNLDWMNFKIYSGTKDWILFFITSNRGILGRDVLVANMNMKDKQNINRDM